MSETRPQEGVLEEETVVHPVEVIPPDPTPIEPAPSANEVINKVGPTVHSFDLTEPILDVLTSPSL